MTDLICVGGRAGPAEQILSYADLKRLGFEDRQISAACREGGLHRLRRGVFVPGDYWRRLKPWERGALEVRAHHLASTGKPVYSHLSAARLWGFAVWSGSAEIHVLHQGRRGDRGAGHDVVRHNQSLPAAQEQHIDGIRVTSRERTVIDCARILPFEAALIVADSALSQGADTAVLARLAGSSPGSRNITKVRRVLAAADGRSESAGETRLRARMLDWEIPLPQLQYVIPTARGFFRADFAWPGLKLLLEFDGLGKYLDYRPTEQALLAERERENLLIEAGWRIIRVRRADFDEPDVLRRRIAAAVNHARRNAPAAA